MLAIGTKVRDLYHYSSNGVIAKPRRGEGTPDGDWYIVEYDYPSYRDKRKKARACVHRDMLAVRND